MDNRLILPLLCAASVALAAAPFSHESKSIATTKHSAAEKSAPIVTTFDVTRPKDDTDKLRFSLNVRNNTGKMLELRFPDGQTHDFVVKDFAGKEIWRWSEGRMFTQAVRNTLLGANETVTYEETWNPGTRTGDFTAVARLESNNHPMQQRADFTLH